MTTDGQEARETINREAVERLALHFQVLALESLTSIDDKDMEPIYRDIRPLIAEIQKKIARAVAGNNDEALTYLYGAGLLLASYAARERLALTGERLWSAGEKERLLAAVGLG